MRGCLRLLSAFFAVALFAGCRTPDPYDAAVAAKLAEIDGKLSKIVEAQEAPPPVVSVETTGREADLEALTKIKPLPDKPTKAEVIAYAQAVADLSVRQPAYSSDDPRHEMVRRIGPGFIIELAPYLNNYYFRNHLSSLVTPQDRAEVLRRLPDFPQLMSVLPYVGLEPKADVREAILEAARKNVNPRLVFPVQPYLPMLAEDPKIWDEFVELSYTKPFLRSAFMKSLEGLEPTARQEKIKRLWEGQKNFPFNSFVQRYGLLRTAAQGGVPEALEQLLALPEKTGNAYVNTSRREVLAQLLPDAAQVPSGEILTWYRSHRDRLRFDLNTNCYRLDSTAR